MAEVTTFSDVNQFYGFRPEQQFFPFDRSLTTRDLTAQQDQGISGQALGPPPDAGGGVGIATVGGLAKNLIPKSFTSGITNALDTFGFNSLGLAPGVAATGPGAALGFPGASIGTQGGIAALRGSSALGSLGTGASLSGILGAGGIGSLLGGLIGPMLGLNSMGSSIGSGLGAGIGFAVGGPVGALIGGGLGLLGGVFGGGHTPNFVATTNLYLQDDVGTSWRDFNKVRDASDPVPTHFQALRGSVGDNGGNLSELNSVANKIGVNLKDLINLGNGDWVEAPNFGALSTQFASDISGGGWIDGAETKNHGRYNSPEALIEGATLRYLRDNANALFNPETATLITKHEGNISSLRGKLVLGGQRANQEGAPPLPETTADWLNYGQDTNSGEALF